MVRTTRTAHSHSPHGATPTEAHEAHEAHGPADALPSPASQAAPDVRLRGLSGLSNRARGDTRARDGQADSPITISADEAPAPPPSRATSPHLRTTVNRLGSGRAAPPASSRQPHFDELRYPGSRAAMRWPAVAACLQWARAAGFTIHPSRSTSCTVRNAEPYYDPRSRCVKYEPRAGRGVGSIHLNTDAMENETLAALTIIHEVAHARRGARAHPADWDAYCDERLTDEGESVFHTLHFTEQAFAAGVDPRRYTRDAAVAMPLSCIQEWHAAYRQHGGVGSEALYRKLGEIYDRHVPQSAGWAASWQRLSTRLGLPAQGGGRIIEIG